MLGQNPLEIAYRQRGESWLAGDPGPWKPEPVTVAATGWCSSRAWCPWHDDSRHLALSLTIRR
jgi:hypothetical protein